MSRLFGSIQTVRKNPLYSSSHILFAIENNSANEASWVYQYLNDLRSRTLLSNFSVIRDAGDYENVGIITTNPRKITMTNLMQQAICMQGLRIDANFYTTERTFEKNPEKVISMLNTQFLAWSRVLCKKVDEKGLATFTFNGKQAGPDDLCLAILFGNMCYMHFITGSFSSI